MVDFRPERVSCWFWKNLENIILSKKDKNKNSYYTNIWKQCSMNDKYISIM